MSFKGSLGVSETEASYGRVQTAVFGSDGTDAKESHTGSPGANGLKGMSTASGSSIIHENGISYKPHSGVYHYIYLTP